MILTTCRGCAPPATIKNQGARHTKEKIRTMTPPNKIVLSDVHTAWLRKHFKHTKNAECAEKLGISPRSVTRLAKKMGLYKTPQFIRKCQQDAAQAAQESHLRNNTYPPKGYVIPNRGVGGFKKGETSLQRLGKRKEAERVRKAVESLAKTRKSERARATFGLPQRTKLRVIPIPKAKVELRWYLKSRGYIVDDVAHVAYYDENTRRGKRIETKPQRWYRFQPIG